MCKMISDPCVWGTFNLYITAEESIVRFFIDCAFVSVWGHPSLVTTDLLGMDWCVGRLVISKYWVLIHMVQLREDFTSNNSLIYLAQEK